MSTQSRLVRTLRGRCLDRNPLRRPSDRAETIVGLCLLLAFLAALPLAVRVAATRTYALAQRARVSALATRRPATAITLRGVPAEVGTPYTLISRAWITARWRLPGGQSRTGWIQVAGGTPAGTPEPIWITRTGDLAAPPPPAAQSSDAAGLGGAGAGIALGGTFLIVWGLVRHALNRHRMAAWAADWVAAESRWNRQRW